MDTWESGKYYLCWVSDINDNPDSDNDIAIVRKGSVEEGFMFIEKQEHRDGERLLWTYAAKLSSEDILEYS